MSKNILMRSKTCLLFSITFIVLLMFSACGTDSSLPISSLPSLMPETSTSLPPSESEKVNTGFSEDELGLININDIQSLIDISRRHIINEDLQLLIPRLAEISLSAKDSSDYSQNIILPSTVYYKFVMDSYKSLHPENIVFDLEMNYIPGEQLEYAALRNEINDFIRKWFDIDFSPLGTYINNNEYYKDRYDASEEYYIVLTGRGSEDNIIFSNDTLTINDDGSAEYTFDLTREYTEIPDEPDYLGNFTATIQLIRDGETVFPRFVQIQKNP